ncbi:MAG: glycoside hydrolase family 15 protein [Deltaproteobacteria bacterium]|nr:glycoside hydrolase family 15 protein [Deltaproteobacteria bacterium]
MDDDDHHGTGSHAVIGDGRSAALVSPAGSIDWLCWPRFDSDAVFAGLLDPKGGRFAISARDMTPAGRAYRKDTAVLETRLNSVGGEIEIVDFMPALDEEEKRGPICDHEIVRIVRCLRGHAVVDVDFEPRTRFGTRPARLHDRGPFGVQAQVDGGVLTLRAEMPLHVVDGRATGSIAVGAGDVVRFAVSFAGEAPTASPLLGTVADDLLARTTAWWWRWVGHLRDPTTTRAPVFPGSTCDAVVRSAIALKLLQYAPSGAIVAAPTTSLPERVGGADNWDYRYCWLRDAAFTAQALFGLGFVHEGEAFVSWCLHSTRTTHPALRILYDVFGRRPRPEHEVALAGFRGSRPVRVGNAAVDQLQLDVYGEIVQATAELTARAGHLDGEVADMLARIGGYLCAHWREPDEGIWEPRSGRRHHTHSRALCLLAVEQLIRLSREHPLRGLPFAILEEQRRALRDDVDRGFSAELQSFTAELEGDTVDAALLQLGLFGVEPPDSVRMRGTLACIEERLRAPRGLLYRSEHSPEFEGAFLVCSFWEAELLARGAGSLDDAEAVFAAAAGAANDVGLLPEEVDPLTGAALGNFPQGFSHIGLINAALAIERRRRRVPTTTTTTTTSAEVMR